MRTKKLRFFFWIFFFLVPTLLRAELFQWTDPRGVVHFTDNLHSVPEHLRNSPHLIIRQELAVKRGSSETSTLSENARQESVSEPKTAAVVPPPEPEPTKGAPPVIYYNPQYFTIVVVDSIVRRPKNRVCLIAESCRPVFRPNFADRRYIHPTVFTGGSRQFIHPSIPQSAPR